VRSAYNIPDYVQWQAPALHVACFASSTSSTALLGNPDTITTVPCTAPASEPTNGSLLVSADNRQERNATIKFVVYEQCAADICAFYYESSFAMTCAGDLESSVTCSSKGTATASVTDMQYLPPVRNSSSPHGLVRAIGRPLSA
jgi:hypothetical protein